MWQGIGKAVGAYFVLAAKQSAGRAIVKEFREWLHSEVRLDASASIAAATPARKFSANRRK